MIVRKPHFLKRPDLIWPFIRSLFLTKLLDYLFGLVGAFSVASICEISFALDFGPTVAWLLEKYRETLAFLLDPATAALIALIEAIAPNLSINLTFSDLWKDGIVLLGIYYQKHARNEFSGPLPRPGEKPQRKPVTATYQISAGLIIALAFAVGFSLLPPIIDQAVGIAFVLTFALAVTSYDAAFLIWSSLFLRKQFARRNYRPVEPLLPYFWSRFSDALIRVLLATGAALLLLGAPIVTDASRWAGQAITLVMLIIGLAWSSRGLRMASEEKGRSQKEIIVAYNGFPAGQLGSAVVFPIVLGYLLTITGVAETWAGPTIEMIIDILGYS